MTHIFPYNLTTFSLKDLYFFFQNYILLGIINTFPMYIKMAYTELLELFVPAFVDGLFLQ